MAYGCWVMSVCGQFMRLNFLLVLSNRVMNNIAFEYAFAFSNEFLMIEQLYSIYYIISCGTHFRSGRESGYEKSSYRSIRLCFKFVAIFVFQQSATA